MLWQKITKDASINLIILKLFFLIIIKESYVKLEGFTKIIET